MSFNRPTLSELVERARGDIRSELGITTILRRSFLAAIARALAGVAHSLHGHLKEISKQAFPDQATGVYLKRWGAIYAVPAKEATYTQLEISGTGVAGEVMPEDTVWVIDNGETYVTDDEVTVDEDGEWTVTITAVNAGADTNIDDGEEISLQNPVAGIDSTATVTETVVEGEDAETEEAHQGRIVDRIQQPPAGGKVTDYSAWALAVAGVTRAWVFPGHRGQGTVDVAFVQDNDDSTIIPSEAEVDAVQEYIDVQKPVTADCIVFAPIARTIDMTIKIRPNTSAVQDAITAELQDLFQREAEVCGAIDPDHISTAETFDGAISLSKVNEAISLATGEEDHELVSPTSDIEPTEGEIAVLGDITFQTLV